MGQTDPPPPNPPDIFNQGSILLFFPISTSGFVQKDISSPGTFHVPRHWSVGRLGHEPMSKTYVTMLAGCSGEWCVCVCWCGCVGVCECVSVVGPNRSKSWSLMTYLSLFDWYAFERCLCWKLFTLNYIYLAHHRICPPRLTIGSFNREETTQPHRFPEITM